MKFSALLFCLLSLVTTPAFAADVAGSKDHPLVTRFSGAEIAAYKAADYDEAVMPIKPIKDDDMVTPDQILSVEGKVTRINYKCPPGKTALEVMRNYEQALAASNFKVIFQCKGADCGSSEGLDMGAYIINSGKISPGGFGGSSFNPKNRYLLAQREQGGENVYVMLYVMEDESNGYTPVFEQVVEMKPMQTGQVKVLDAAAMEQSLTATGKVSIYGVYFDTAKAEIKPDSQAALSEMVKLMNADPALKVYIVGHTDNIGTLPVNLELSQRRADAVVQALAAAKISPDRMLAKGVASLAPVSTNASEQGRSLNRRVELVVQ